MRQFRTDMRLNLMAKHPDMGSQQPHLVVPTTTTTSLDRLIPETALEALSPPFTKVRRVSGEEEDPVLAAAVLAWETGTMTPLLKEELRCHIQARRLQEGKEELHVEFEDPATKQMELTPEEEERVVKRREQNRSAAQRFRQKQKDTIYSLKKKTEQLESENTLVRTQLRQLQNENALLRNRIERHLECCLFPNDLLQDGLDNGIVTSQT